MLRAARAALGLVIPGELLMVILLASGVSVPPPVMAVSGTLVACVITLETVVVARLFRAARREGAGRRRAVRLTYERLVPITVRRLLGFEAAGMAALALWIARRRHGVPPGARALPYAGAQTFMMGVFVFAMVVELVGLELLLRALDAPAALRVTVLVIDVYGVLIAFAVRAACATRPHVVTETEVRVRYGAFFDLRIPRERVTAVRRVSHFDEKGLIGVDGDRLAVAVSSQTNIALELDRPITATRPLGRTVEVGTVRFFADDPAAALDALRTRPEPVAEAA
ncbi:hypothetical protein [Streptomyces alkaliphilus]|uniref:hypothetical protein n=1 Tax=Streptomyces alkaliphilus TaxID=1472722 RepID=UPI00117FD5F7|nr:hypothetical protein [Streptomyces alkaliphilus]MQS09545.1 hypothetical protein [Streptomyces alkaliphilus]